MLVTITEYRDVARDGAGNALPLGANKIEMQSQTAAGAFAALNASTRFVRLATDTAITIDNGDGDEEFYPAGVEFIAVQGGATLTTTAV